MSTCEPKRVKPPPFLFSESEFKAALLKAMQRLPGVSAWRQQSGVLPMRGRWVYCAPKGATDLIARVAPGGWMLEVETKCAWKHTDEQVDWQADVEAAGGIYVLARAERGETLEAAVARCMADIRAEIAERRSRFEMDRAASEANSCPSEAGDVGAEVNLVGSERLLGAVAGKRADSERS